MDLLLYELEALSAAADALARDIEREIAAIDLSEYRERMQAGGLRHPVPPGPAPRKEARRAVHLRLMKT
jgi:hypothetical protein